MSWWRRRKAKVRLKIAFENYFVWKRSCWWARGEGKKAEGRFLAGTGGGGGPDQQHQQQEEVCVRCVCACDSGHDDDQRVSKKKKGGHKSVGIGNRVPDLACGRNQGFQERAREKSARARD